MAVTQWGTQMILQSQTTTNIWTPSHSFFRRLWVWNRSAVMEFSCLINPQKMVIVPSTRKRDLRGLKAPTLFVSTLQLTTKVKCLWHTLDRELTWKAQPNNVMNKAYRAFWTCNSTSCKTWGVKPTVVQWIYIMVRPSLIYGSMVW